LQGVNGKILPLKELACAALSFQRALTERSRYATLLYHNRLFLEGGARSDVTMGLWISLGNCSFVHGVFRRQKPTTRSECYRCMKNLFIKLKQPSGAEAPLTLVGLTARVELVPFPKSASQNQLPKVSLSKSARSWVFSCLLDGEGECACALAPVVVELAGS
jgi:hypothetical protein